MILLLASFEVSDYIAGRAQRLKFVINIKASARFWIGICIPDVSLLALTFLKRWSLSPNVRHANSPVWTRGWAAKALNLAGSGCNFWLWWEELDAAEAEGRCAGVRVCYPSTSVSKGGEKQEKTAPALLHIITDVNFPLPAPPCFVSIRSVDDLSHIKYSVHPGVKGLLKNCIVCMSFVLLISFELRFFNFPLIFVVIWWFSLMENYALLCRGEVFTKMLQHRLSQMSV